MRKHTPFSGSPVHRLPGLPALGAAITAILLAACSVSAPPTRQAGSPVAAPAGDATRGAYLAAIFACQDCHSPREANGITLAPATLMAGGQPFSGPWGLVHSANVTEMARAFNDATLSQVLRGQLFSLQVMPTAAFNQMSVQDMRDLIAYLRTLRPVSYDAPANDLEGDFVMPPLNPPVPIPEVAPAGPTVERGKYLVTMAACQDCHTPLNANGQPDETRILAGGAFTITDKLGRVVTPPNLTPDKATGLGNWTDAEIAAALREGKRPGGGQLNPLMPYATAFYAYTDEDVAAVIAYLRSLPAVNNPIPPNPPFEP
jgi:mono/diheme cytochrome c family protein